MTGPRLALSTVVLTRSYSRNSAMTSWEAQVKTSGNRLRSSVATSASCSGLR